MYPVPFMLEPMPKHNGRHSHIAATLRHLDCVLGTLLLAQVLGVIGPGKVNDGNLEKGVAACLVSFECVAETEGLCNVRAVLNTSQGVVPGEEGSEETKETTGLLEGQGSCGIAHVGSHLLGSEEQESQIKREEQQEKGHGRTEGAKNQNSGENEPAEQEEAQNVCLLSLGVIVQDMETGSEDDGVGQPETAVRRQCGGTESIASGHFPAVNVSHVESGAATVSTCATYHMPASS